MAKQLHPGDTVVFTGATIQRCGHAPAVVQFKATVAAVRGALADTITSSGTYKTVPVANLAKVAPCGVILDLP